MNPSRRFVTMPGTTVCITVIYTYIRSEIQKQPTVNGEHP